MGSGTPEDFAFAMFGLAVMQSAYWYARRLQPRIWFRHRVVLGHVLLCVSEVSFFFVSALATVAMFDHWRRSQFVFWKLMLLVPPSSPSFAINVSSQVLGTLCWSHNPRMLGKQRSNHTEPASNENIAARSYNDGSSNDPIVDPNDTVGFTEGRGINNSRTVCGDYASSDGNNHGFFSSGGCSPHFAGMALKNVTSRLFPFFLNPYVTVNQSLKG